VLVLVFGSALFVVLSAAIGFSIGQSQVVTARVEIQRATDIAEAGLNYFRWQLAHFPDDTTGGTGLPGPYVRPYVDPEGGAIGEFSISVASSTYCGDVASIDVRSTGFTYAAPQYRRTVSARYVRPTVAEYAYIINSNVWAGASRTIIGPYHSNGGIRMDGTNLSTVSSGQTTWNCTSTFGCNTPSTTPGVFSSTANANRALFNFPSAPINFTGLVTDLAQMQNRAQTRGGIFIPPSGVFGYRVTFNSNGTITVRRVTSTTQVWGFNNDTDWQQERHVIAATSNTGAGAGTYTIPASCPLIFVEDKVWLDGVVNQKVTLAAADTDTAGLDHSIILNDNITYSTSSAGLLAIAEQDVLLGLNVPDNMTINGIMIARNGRYGRNHYCSSAAPACPNNTYNLPSGLANYRFRSTLTMNGTIVSNGRVGDQWSSGGLWISGFGVRNNSYDRNLVESPPPLVPETSDVYVFRDWREEN
jgi:hypothetical protein